VTFRETSRLPTGMSESRGIAIAHDGATWAVGDRKLARLSEGDGPAEIAIPLSATCLDFSSDGLIYVGSKDRVFVLRPDGSTQATWPALSESAFITAIACSKDRIWVADWASKLIYGYDREGAVRSTLCARDEAAGYPGIIAPSPHLDVAVAGDQVFVSNPGMHRVETHTADGRLVSTWGAPGSDLASLCGCCNPVDFALMPGGGFVTGEKGIPRVKIHNAQGHFVEVVAGPDQFASNTMSLDLAVSGDGRVLVLDAIQGAVRVFSRMREVSA
jgi:hypothetical protein